MFQSQTQRSTTLPSSAVYHRLFELFMMQKSMYLILAIATMITCTADQSCYCAYFPSNVVILGGTPYPPIFGFNAGSVVDNFSTHDIFLMILVVMLLILVVVLLTVLLVVMLVLFIRLLMLIVALVAVVQVPLVLLMLLVLVHHPQDSTTTTKITTTTTATIAKTTTKAPCG